MPNETKTIQNEWYKIEYADQKLSIFSFAGEHVFLTDGTLYGEKHVQAEVADISCKTFGQGKALRLVCADGSVDTAMLYPGCPFILFRTSVANKSASETILKQVCTFRANLQMPIAADLARSFGTGGIDEVAGYGSYSFLAVVDPATRSGVVSGWLTHDRGDGIVFSDRVQGSIQLSSRIDYGRLSVKGEADEELELFAIGWFADARLGLEAYADAIKDYHRISLPAIPNVYCTWYDCGRAGTEAYLFPLADFTEKRLKPFGHTVIQLDDGWQLGTRRNGPSKVFEGYDPNGPFPNGMTRTAEYIRAKGLTPGIWLMPFAADEEEPFFQEHADWLVKNPDGKPMVSAWGGASLDMSYAPAREYLVSVLKRIVGEWGYTYLKMDGLYTGTATDQIYINNKYKEDNLGVPDFFDKEKAPIEIYRDGLRLVRETVGDDVFLLGCCVRQNMRSFGGSFGLVDAMRIGPDNSANLDRILRGPMYGGQTYFLHGRVWYNDPDPIYVRESVPYAIARSLASWQAFSGQLNTSSDNYPALPEERVELLKRTMPNHGLKPRPADLFEAANPGVWCLTDVSAGTRKDLIGLFNWDLETPRTFVRSLGNLGLDKNNTYIGVDFWSGQFIGPLQRAIETTLPAGDCRILALKPIAVHPQVLGTSRHVSQGSIDLREEAWEPERQVLSGASHVVGGDPYELRIAVMAEEGVWKATGVQAKGPGAEQDGHVQASLFEQNGGTLRVRLDSPVSGLIRWSIAFAPDPGGDARDGFISLQALEELEARPTAEVSDQAGESIEEEPTDF